MVSETQVPEMGGRQVGSGEAQAQSNVAEAVRAEITQIIANLIIKAQELGFELATCECPHVSNCELAKKAREVVREIKKLVAIQRKLTR